MKHIKKCAECKRYTLKEECCSKPTIMPKPAKFSPEDPYGSYRRTAKQERLKERGLI